MLSFDAYYTPTFFERCCIRLRVPIPVPFSTLHKALLQAKEIEYGEIVAAVQRAALRGPLPHASHPLQRHLEAIVRLCQQTPSRQVVQKILVHLRHALHTTAYAACKEDETNPATRFVHHLVFALFADADLQRGFAAIGELLGAVAMEYAKPDTLVELLRAVPRCSVPLGLIGREESMSFLVWQWRKAMGAIASHYHMLGAYDPKAVDNHSGVLFDEGPFRTIVTGTPTIGNKVSPEFHALLQAIENRAHMVPHLLAKDPYPYCAFAYTNLQHIASSHEGPRSCALMRLNQQYPMAFHGITIAQDSSFYRAGVYASSEARICQEAQDSLVLDEAYRQAMLEQLLEPANFVLGVKGEYFFPGGFESWEPVFEQCVEEAYRVAIAAKQPRSYTLAHWRWAQKALFRELTHLHLIRAFQQRVLEDVGQQGRILCANACKENVDRGGRTNALLGWLFGSGDEEARDQRLFCMWHGRPLLARGRFMSAKRAEPGYAVLDALGGCR